MVYFASNAPEKVLKKQKKLNFLKIFVKKLCYIVRKH